MASKKKTSETPRRRKPKPLKFGSSAAGVYRLCEDVLSVRSWLSEERTLAHNVLVSDPAKWMPPKDWLLVKEHMQARLEQVNALRERFETRLVTDPVAAVTEMASVRAAPGEWLDIREAMSQGSPVRNARLRSAVMHVAEWFRHQNTARKKWKYLAAPVLVLTPISTVREEEDLERLAKHRDVQAALRGEEEQVQRRSAAYEGALRRHRLAYMNAAIVLVARATGTGEQTVRRALKRSNGAEE